jgi:hypothetical protein
VFRQQDPNTVSFQQPFTKAAYLRHSVHHSCFGYRKSHIPRLPQALLAATIATACAPCSPQAPSTSAVASAPTAAATLAAASTAPALGIDLSWVDHGVKPGNDFFKYANGNWLKTAEIPPTGPVSAPS